MDSYTPHQAKYFAEQITLKRSESSVDGLASAMSGAKVDLNPHQVDAALFALQSPLSTGALLADEVGLGKTIEAGLVLAQYWSERKRHILLIVPASLRMQWRGELLEKFYIDSVIMESSTFNKAKKEGKPNPFDLRNKVVICSYNFASRKIAEIKNVDWDLAILDEAHKLRNVYKASNVTGNKIKTALSGRRKLLLTATPLQNNLMELYGLTSIIDDHVFGDAKTFKEMYVAVSNPDIRNRSLRKRLQPFCKRTLRKQVTEYVKYTNRLPILQEYQPTPDEETLYNDITNYLQTDKLYALPEGQRSLITMVLRKLLASSSFAISGTLESLISRLEDMLRGVESELNLDDFDTYDEYRDEEAGDDEAEDDLLTQDLIKDRDAIQAELNLLRGYADLAKSITTNSKGDNLLIALQQGFDTMEKLGGQRKAVIFTESRRTQEYLFNLLTNHGYEGKIVFLNGSNNDPISKEIYSDWKQRHKDDGMISGSKQADMKAAVVEAFKNDANILIGTEAASEGINLQFCSIVVNYDLPWNPQRIEQRIGRCHRYGQQNDVVVINFLNNKNAADRRVYELLDQKFTLFSGVFGSSDEVLGSVESGVDFEKRIADIYQKCKTHDDIQREFDELQEDLADQINQKMIAARQSILENFDEDVAERLSDCQKSTVSSLDKFSQWMYYFFLTQKNTTVVDADGLRLRYQQPDGSGTTYSLKWKEAEERGDVFLRKDDEQFRSWLDQAMSEELTPVFIRFDNTGSERNIAFFNDHIGMRGTLSLDKLSYDGISNEEYLIYTAETDAGSLDEDLVNKLFELPGTVIGPCSPETQTLIQERQKKIDLQKEHIQDQNKAYFIAECEKLDAYSEDLKDGLERDIKELSKLIKEKKRLFKSDTANKTLEEMLEAKEEINKMESKRKEMRRNLYEQQDKIDMENESLQEEIRQKLEGHMTISHIMTIEFEVV